MHSYFHLVAFTVTLLYKDKLHKRYAPTNVCHAIFKTEV